MLSPLECDLEDFPDIKKQQRNSNSLCFGIGPLMENDIGGIGKNLSSLRRMREIFRRSMIFPFGSLRRLFEFSSI